MFLQNFTIAENDLSNLNLKHALSSELAILKLFSAICKKYYFAPLIATAKGIALVI